jgi:hypothetical protein
MTSAFWASDAFLLAAQSATVALPRSDAPAAVVVLARRLASPWWALVPVASIVGAIFAIRAAGTTADALTWLALLAIPPLAAVALGWAVHGGRPALALLAAPLFALAWADRGGLAGEAAGVLLAALSCVTLGVLLTAVAPHGWLKAGIVLMAAADTALVTAQLLQPANEVLNAAAPPAGLPQLQRALFGDAVIGYGDLFIAGVLGALVAAEAPRDRTAPLRTALLTLAIAACFDLLFLVVDVLPATVPVALALIARELRNSRAATVSRGPEEPIGWKPQH